MRKTKLKEQSADNYDLLGDIAKEMKQMPSVKDTSAQLKKRKKCISLVYKGVRFFLVQDVSTLKRSE